MRSLRPLKCLTCDTFYFPLVSVLLQGRGKATRTIAFVFEFRKSERTDRLLNSYADSGKVTVLGIGFALTVGVADGVGAR